MAKKSGFKIGEKVFYSNYQPYIVMMQVVTIKDIRSEFPNSDPECEHSGIVVITEELEGYISLGEIYSLKQLEEMLSQPSQSEGGEK